MFLWVCVVPEDCKGVLMSLCCTWGLKGCFYEFVLYLRTEKMFLWVCVVPEDWKGVLMSLCFIPEIRNNLTVNKGAYINMKGVTILLNKN